MVDWFVGPRRHVRAEMAVGPPASGPQHYQIHAEVRNSRLSPGQFSALVIYLSLISLVEQPSCALSSDENLIFRKSDFSIRFLQVSSQR